MTVGGESLRDVSWDAGEILPHGRQLLMKGYNGAVKVHEVIVRYADEPRSPDKVKLNTPPAPVEAAPPTARVNDAAAHLPQTDPVSIRTTLLDLKDAAEILYRRVSDDGVLGKDDMIVDTAQDISRTARHILSRVLHGGEAEGKGVNQMMDQMNFLKKQIARAGVQEEGLQRKFEKVELLTGQLKVRLSK